MILLRPLLEGSHPISRSYSLRSSTLDGLYQPSFYIHLFSHANMTVTKTYTRHTKQYSLWCNMDSAGDKEERKREVSFSLTAPLWDCFLTCDNSIIDLLNESSVRIITSLSRQQGLTESSRSPKERTHQESRAGTERTELRAVGGDRAA